MASHGIDYDSSDPNSILSYGQKVVGKSAREICELVGVPDPSSRPGWKPTKNALGDSIEAYFGIPKNNSPEPDFPLAKIELKVLPLKKGRKELLVKESTSISMMDYMELVHETWTSASVRKKLEHILFVFFVIEPIDLMTSTVRAVELWEAQEGDRAMFQIDWEGTQRKVIAGQAHHLSEEDDRVLAARRKGTGKGKDLREQPNSTELAPSRAWALKSWFTRQILKEKVLRVPFERAYDHFLPEILASRTLDPAEQGILRLLRPLEGLTLRSVAERFGVPLDSSKNLAATIVNRSLKFQRIESEIKEFDQLGISVKTLNLDTDTGEPYEAVSFPAMVLKDFVTERWEPTEGEEESQLRNDLHRILFVPTFHRTDEGQPDRILGRAFFWSPSPEQWGMIQVDWERYQTAVMEGMARYYVPPGWKRRTNNLPKDGETHVIHMRPHGRDSLDVDIDPKGNLVTKQCFWLNKQFVWDMVTEHAMPPPGVRHV